jgi:hybrid polyketide synthase / nonribosomal peptide synthetase ACE1
MINYEILTARFFTETVQDVTGQDLPYYGVLSRGKNDVECFADALGDVWTSLGPSVVKFEAYANLFKKYCAAKNELIKSLPSYAWDHNHAHWYETRMSRNQRLRKDAPHPLLGVRSGEAQGEYRWRNYIKPAELPWLTGHKIQGQLLFPGSGFAVLAIEAAQALATPGEIRMIELLSFSIHRALGFSDEESGVETMFILANVQKTSDSLSYITADFVCNACLNKDTGDFTSMASGKLVLHLGNPSNSALPDRPKAAYEMKDTDVDDFYKDLAGIGYNYADMFMGISKLQRTADACSGTIFSQDTSGNQCDFKFHPAPFDVGFQAAFAALGAPGDGRLWTLQIPTNIERIRFNPHACRAGGGVNIKLPFDAAITDSESYEIVSDIEIYEETGRHCIIQVEGLHVSPLTAATTATDRPMFAETIFDIADPDVQLVKVEQAQADARALLGLFPERCMLFYLKQVHETITPKQREECDEHRISVLNWAVYLVEITSKGQHPHLKREWLEDTYEGLKPQMDE